MQYTYSKDTLDYMFNYLTKYVGTYRVKAELDEDEHDFPRTDSGSLDPTFDDLYIPCKRGIIKHTYIGNDILCICFYDSIKTGNGVYREIKDKYPKIELELDNSVNDVYIYFHAEDIKKIATIIHPRTSGSSIAPFSNKNLPKVEYKIPAKDMSILYDITKDLSKVETMHFYKNLNNKFINGIRKLDGKKFDAKEAYKKSRMGAREFIHSYGLWDKYVAYAKKYIKEYKK